VRSRPEDLNLQYGIRYFIVSSQDTPGQLDELDGQFSLKACTRPFSRCLRDNACLREISADQAQGRAPDKILERHDRFYECPACGRVYWQGSHWERMTRRLEIWGWKVGDPVRS
jgi:uncharacterized protein